MIDKTPGEHAERLRLNVESLFRDFERTTGFVLGGTFSVLNYHDDPDPAKGARLHRVARFTVGRGDPPSPDQVPAVPPPGTKVKFGADGKVYPAGDDATHYVVPPPADVVANAFAGCASPPPAPPVEYARAEPPVGGAYTGDICSQCGNAKMRRSGTCATCEICGTTSGCS